MSIDSSSNSWAKAIGADQKHFNMLYERMMDGFAFHQIVVDESGKPIDYIFLEVNKAFENMTGLKRENVIGKRVTEVLKGIENDPADWIGRYGKVALDCQPLQFENYAHPLDRWYGVSAYCPEKGYFVALFKDITKRKKAEQSLLKSEEMLKQSQEIAHLGSWELDLNENCLIWSDEVYRIFGLKPQEFGATYQAFLEAVHPDDRAAVDNAYSSSVREGKNGYEIEHRVVRKDSGEVRFVKEKCTHIKDASGKIVQSIGMVHDITERRMAEAENQKAKDDWERTFDAVPDLITILDSKYHIVRANRAMINQLGIEPQQAVGLKCYNTVHGENVPSIDCPHAQLLKDGKEHTAEVHEPHLGGDFIVSDTPLKDRNGQLIGSVHVARDITKRKQTEEALRTSEQRWSTTLSSIGDAVIATDTQGKITFLNPVAEQLTGWTLAEAKQKPIEEVFHIVNERTRKVVENPVTKVLKIGLIVGLANHTVLIRKDGTEVPIDDSGAPIVGDDGAIRGVVLVFRDITERKKAEDALQRQAALIDLSPDAIIVRKLDGTITFWSRGAEKLYGWTRKEAIGKNTHVLFKTKFSEPLDTINAKLISEKHWTGELVHQTKSGDEVTVQSWWLAEETEHGEIKTILESNVDLTERKRAEEMLKKQASLINLSPDGILIKAVDDTITFWNKGAEKLYGWTKEEAVGQKSRVLFQTKFSEPYENILNRLNSQGLWTGEKIHTTKDGRQITVSSRWLARKNSKGQITEILETNEDITERKKAEKEIARLASFPTLNPSPVVEVDQTGRITYANPATKTLIPTLEADGLQHIFFNNWASVKKVFQEKDITSFGREVKINNHWYHQQFYLVPHTQQIRIYATDIDELKQTEEARAKAQTKLEENAVMLEEYASQMEELAKQRAQQLQNAERLAAIGATAGMVGHDIRNPLQAITGDMYLIAEEVSDMPEGDNKAAICESIESVNRNIVYINKIVSDLQDYTRPLRPNLQDANLSEIVKGTLGTIVIPKGIEVSVDIKDNAKLIKTDVAFMRRLLTNLVTNAVQAMQEQGKVTIDASKPKDTIILTVDDTGIGIPEEVKAKMFTPLFTTKSKGQGLGLAVVKRLVEALGGSIGFESDAGKGTKFIIELPQKS